MNSVVIMFIFMGALFAIIPAILLFFYSTGDEFSPNSISKPCYKWKKIDWNASQEYASVHQEKKEDFSYTRRFDKIA